MKKSKCSLGFQEYTKAEYTLFCERVDVGIYGNSGTFPTPPLTQAEYEVTFAKYSEAEAVYKISPSIGKTHYLVTKDAMNICLVKTAEYVDTVADGDESIINLSGFVPTKTTTTKSTAIIEPATGTVKRGPNTGQITTESKAIKGKGVIIYNIIVSIGAPLPDGCFVNGELRMASSTVNFVMNITRPRKKVVSNLPPGSTVYVYFLASNPVSAAPIGQPLTVTV